MAISRDRIQNLTMDYEDSGASFGNNFTENAFNYGAPAGITSLPIQKPIQPIPQPTAQLIAQPAPLAPPFIGAELPMNPNSGIPDETGYTVEPPVGDSPTQAEPAPLAPAAPTSAIYSNDESFLPPPTFNSGSEPVGEKLVHDVTELPTLTPVEKLVQNESPPVEQAPTGVFGLPITPVQPPAQPKPAAPVAPTGPDPKTIDSLTNQILGQKLTGKWTGQGYGSAEKNAADMARILAGIGITDIKQFGKVPTYEQATAQKSYNGQVAQQDEEGNYFISVNSGFDQDGSPISSRQNVDPKDLQTIYGSYQNISSNPDEGSAFVPADQSELKMKNGVPFIKTGENFGNKLTGQAVPNTYTSRQTGNFFGGTYEGKGNTGYGVQFDAQGNPIFYTQGASSNDLANLMKDLGPIGQIAIAVATGGLSLPAQLAANAGIQLLAGGNLKDIVKGTALSYLGAQAGNLISGSSGITDLLGKTGSDIASRTAQQFVGSGGKADLKDALLGNALSSGVGSVIGQVPGLDNLSPADRNLTSNLIASVATGTPINQAIQNALVGKVSSDVKSSAAQTRNAPTAQPQTYEDLMAGIEPRTPNQPSTDTGPSNDDILRMINYDPSLINNAGVDTLVTKLAADPAIGKGRTMDDIDFSSLMGSFDAGPGAVDLSGIDLSNLLAANSPIDFSQVGGDYSPNLLNELRNSMTDTGNASSLFSGDGGIDLSALGSIVNDDGTTGGIQDTINSLTSGQNNQGYYDEITGEFVQNKLGGLLNPLEGSAGDNSQGYYNEITGEFVQNPLGGLSGPLDSDVGNLDPNSKWEYSQTKPNVWTNDKGEEIDLSYLPNTRKTMTGAEIMKKAGAVAGSGGKPSTSTKAATKTAAKPGTSPGTSPGTNNTGLIMALMAMMAMMNSKGSGGGSSAASTIPALSANRSQLPYGPSSGAPAARPGAGGVNYFTPMNYTPKAAGGGLMSLAGGGMSNLGGYSDGGRLLRGPGDGVSDSIPATIGGKQPARLAEGEFVVPARIVSELGNGSTDAGAQKLYAMMDRVQNVRRKTKNVASNTKAHKYLPA